MIGITRIFKAGIFSGKQTSRKSIAKDINYYLLFKRLYTRKHFYEEDNILLTDGI